MVNKIDANIREIQRFFETLSIDIPFSQEKELGKFKIAYRQLHSLLIWNMIITGNQIPEDNYGKHFREGISDMSQGFALISMSLYKPARMMARSSIENVVRVSVAHRNGDYKVKSVYNLFDIALGLYKNSEQSHRILQQLHQEYGDLCRTVHSAEDKYLSLSIPFEEILKFDDEKFEMSVQSLTKSSSLINQFIFTIFERHMRQCEDHRSRDLILDSIPNDLKCAIRNT